MNARNQILGRFASETARRLSGKNKPGFVPFLDSGDSVVVINAAQIKVSGKKETAKKYVRHSGFPGGYKEETLAQVRQERPEQIIIHAVRGMLPKNKLGSLMLKRLHVFSGSEHPFKRQVTSSEHEQTPKTPEVKETQNGGVK